MKNQAPVVEDTMFGGPTGADCATRALGGDPETPGLVLASSAVDGKQGDAEQFAEVTPETPGGDVATLGDQLDTIELSERFEFPEKVKVFDIKSSSIAVFGSAEVPPLTPVVMWDPTIPEHVRIFFSDFWGHPAEVAGLDAWLLDAASLATDEEEAEIRWAQFDVMISRFMFNWRFRITPGGGLPFIPMQFIIVGRDAIEASVNEEWSSKLHMEHLEEGSHGFLFNRVFRVAMDRNLSLCEQIWRSPNSTVYDYCPWLYHYLDDYAHWIQVRSGRSRLEDEAFWHFSLRVEADDKFVAFVKHPSSCSVTQHDFAHTPISSKVRGTLHHRFSLNVECTAGGPRYYFKPRVTKSAKVYFTAIVVRLMFRSELGCDEGGTKRTKRVRFETDEKVGGV